MMGEVMMKYDQWQVMNDETQREFDADEWEEEM